MGDVLLYNIKVTNTGDTPLSIDLDERDDCVNLTPPAGVDPATDKLAAGASWTYTCEHTVVDGDNGSYTNEACVIGEDGFGGDTGAEVCDTTTTEVIHPAIHVEKSGTPTTTHDGETVTYTYDVTNTGDTPLKDVDISAEDKCDPVTLASKHGDTSPGTLDVAASGEHWSFTCDYTVDHGDEDGDNNIKNTAEAEGFDKLDKRVTDEDDFTIKVVHPDVAIDKEVKVDGRPARLTARPRSRTWATSCSTTSRSPTPATRRCRSTSMSAMTAST